MDAPAACRGKDALLFYSKDRHKRRVAPWRNPEKENVMRIAVLLDGKGRAAGLDKSGTILVYERVDNTWAADRKLEYESSEYATMAALRKYLGTVRSWLDDCNILAAKPSNGFYRVVFESFGVALWAIDGYPQDFISQIEHFYTHRKAESCESPEPITPIAHKAGYYSVDLKEVMAHRSAFNSKQILMPFLREAKFMRLEITCDHVPKWFASELPALNLRADVESYQDGVRVHVYPLK